MGRQPHHPPLKERFETSPPAPENSTPVEAMAHRLKMPEGRTLCALRKQTPKPVFEIIKSVMGLRQFLLRGPTMSAASGASSSPNSAVPSVEVHSRQVFHHNSSMPVAVAEPIVYAISVNTDRLT
jgi:hypothetical protein